MKVTTEELVGTIGDGRSDPVHGSGNEPYGTENWEDQGGVGRSGDILEVGGVTASMSVLHQMLSFLETALCLLCSLTAQS